MRGTVDPIASEACRTARAAELLPAPPSTARAFTSGRRIVRRGFRLFNRWFMLPLLRAGLGGWISTPVGGWLLVLSTRGRRTGLIRDVPLSYFISDGSAWVMAGLGGGSDWLRNATLGASVTDIQWVLNAYYVALVSCVLIAGSLGDIVGHRRLFVAGLVVIPLVTGMAGTAFGGPELAADDGSAMIVVAAIAAAAVIVAAWTLRAVSRHGSTAVGN